MNPDVRGLIDKSTQNRVFNEHLFIQAQSELPPELRMQIRYSPEIAKLYFGIDVLPANKAGYYYWDNTTLCFKFPLQEYIREGFDVLEIGPGAAATMSLFIFRNWKNVIVDCAEINPDFIQSARESIALNGAKINIFQSDMTQNVRKKYDLVFMNPPYVKASGLKELGIDPHSPEGKAGYAGDDGTLVVRKFLNEVHLVLKNQGVALLGVNTRHLEDEVVVKLIRKSHFTLSRKYYSDELAQPRGPYSQIYVLHSNKRGATIR